MLQEAIDTIEEFAPENTRCSSECPNPATHYHNFKPLCDPHYLAVTADGQLFSEVGVCDTCGLSTSEPFGCSCGGSIILETAQSEVTQHLS